MNIFQKIAAGFVTTSHAPDPQPVKKEPAPIQKTIKGKCHNVAGVKYYEANILKMAVENPDYFLSDKEIIKKRLGCERIYQYKFSANKAELLPDTSNPHDPNAVKVMVDNLHVGYIKAGSCKQILKLLANDNIERIDAEIYGGAYKQLICDEKGNIYDREKGKTDFKVRISIIEKEDSNK